MRKNPLLTCNNHLPAGLDLFTSIGLNSSSFATVFLVLGRTMRSDSLAFLFLLPSALAHHALWHPSQYGFNSGDGYDPVVPLSGDSFAQWWFHGYTKDVPAEVIPLPAGKAITVEVGPPQAAELSLTSRARLLAIRSLRRMETGLPMPATLLPLVLMIPALYTVRPSGGSWTSVFKLRSQPRSKATL
jgi:hypothetical protein